MVVGGDVDLATLRLSIQNAAGTHAAHASPCCTAATQLQAPGALLAVANAMPVAALASGVVPGSTY